MDLLLQQRLEKVKELKASFDITFQRISDASGLHRDAVQHAMAGRKYYVTEGNISAIEAGIENILKEYRQRLCGENQLV